MPYEAIPTFWIEPSGEAEVGLRRYRSSTLTPDGCPRSGGWGYHGAIAKLGTAPLPIGEAADGWRGYEQPRFDYPGHDDPRWPTHCDCGYEFTPEDTYQDWYEPLYRRPDTGEILTLRSAPPGAMWDAWWYPWKGPDGLCLVVKCPSGGEWMIDGRASNCTAPDDTIHRCWVRHGTPPGITVDKDGNTCAAGAGSIVSGDYHGFLRNGMFTRG